MSRFRTFAWLVLLAGVGTLAAAEPKASTKQAAPNIVVILADDYGYGSAGCCGANEKLVRTPAIDRLAREGRRFTDANTTSSVCSPTRYSLMTGRYCWRTSLTHEVLGTFSPLHIETTRLNMASLLKAHGYRTAAIGKWHLGYGTNDGSPKWRTDYSAVLSPGPLDLGFQYHFGVPSNHGDVTGVFVENQFVYGLRSGKIPAGMKPTGPVPDEDSNFAAKYVSELEKAGRPEPIEIDAPRRVDDRVMPELTDKAVKWLEQQKPGEPFFLYLTPVAVHRPTTPEKELAGKSAAGIYGDWIQQLDRTVSRVLDTLDRKGLADNTLVLFSSDNGGVREPQQATSAETIALNAGLAVNGPWRGGKHHVWEGGFRVPFVVRWPGKAPAGTVCDETISLADVLATTAAIVGDKLPAASQAAEDSHNILPAILGEKYAAPLRPDLIVHSADGVFAIRKGPWKWIEGVPVEDIKPGARKARAAEYKAQLYNLKDDPAETTDVSAAHPQVVQELSALLERYRAGGYSRELPPVAAPRAAIELPPVAGNVVVEAAFDKVPEAPWVNVRGKWSAKDNAVWGSEVASDNAVAAQRYPLAQTDGDIQYELSLPPAGGHTLRVTSKERDQVLLIQISARNVKVTNLATGKILADAPAKFAAQTWLPVRACFRGNELLVQVGNVTTKATAPLIGQPKVAFALLAHGENLGFRKVVVHGDGKK